MGGRGGSSGNSNSDLASINESGQRAFDRAGAAQNYVRENGTTRQYDDWHSMNSLMGQSHEADYRGNSDEARRLKAQARTYYNRLPQGYRDQWRLDLSRD